MTNKTNPVEEGKTNKAQLILMREIPNTAGTILVRLMNIEAVEKKDGLCVVEMLNLYDKNESGCVVGFWRLRQQDGYNWITEFSEVDDRLTQTKFDDGVLEQALYWGRKISNVVMDFYFNL